MPKKKQKRLGIQKFYNRAIVAKRKARKEVKEVLSVDVTYHEKRDVISINEVSERCTPPVETLSPLISRVKESIRERENAERRWRYQTQKAKVSPATPKPNMCESVLPPLHTPAANTGHNDGTSQVPSVSPALRRVVQQLVKRGKVGGGRGRPFNRQMQNAIWTTYEFCKMEKVLGRPVISFDETVRRTAAILKISRPTVVKYLKIIKKCEPLITPNKSRKRPFTKQADGFEMAAIECLIYEFHRKSKVKELISNSKTYKNKWKRLNEPNLRQTFATTCCEIKNPPRDVDEDSE